MASPGGSPLSAAAGGAASNQYNTIQYKGGGGDVEPIQFNSIQFNSIQCATACARVLAA